MKIASVRKCSSCGNDFRPSFKKRAQKYCSRSCVWKGTKGAQFNTKISRESAIHRGDLLRGRGSGKSYRKLNGRHEHRTIAEQMLGRCLESYEVVHHRDHNIFNNHPSNLMVLKQADHMREHGLGIKGAPLLHKPWEARWGVK